MVCAIQGEFFEHFKDAAIDINNAWRLSRDGNYDCFELFKRHYSYREYADGRRQWPTYRNRKLFVGPGKKVVLLHKNASALFAWRQFIDDSGQAGINNSVFRNESPDRSSDLILQAESYIPAYFGLKEKRLYTYVNHTKTSSPNPGYCYQMAGWQRCGKTADGKIILEKYLA